MKKKEKHIVTILFVILAFSFLFVVKAIKLTLPEIVLGCVFFKFLYKALENFHNGEALQSKLSIIT